MRRLILIFSLSMFLPALAAAEMRFPTPDFKKTGYKIPETKQSPVAGTWRVYMDVGVLIGALSLGSWLVFKKRSRTGVFLLMVFSLIYFGFYRKGCVCSVGSVQNVALAIGPNGYTLPWTVAAFFAVPLIFALFYGRVFCAAVCPLGAIQDIFLFKPIAVPNWLEHALGLFPWFYLGLGVMLAFAGSDFVICDYDPFVGFFRFGGPTWMLFLGGALLVLSMFVGRTYCRFICPYSVLLRLVSMLSRRQVSITPKECINCRLCEKSCPFGALRLPTPPPSAKPVTNRNEFAYSLAALPAIIALFIGVGWLTARALVHIDWNVQLSKKVYAEVQKYGDVKGLSDETAAFRTRSQNPKDLYKLAEQIRMRYRNVGLFMGGWMGLVVGGKVLALAVRRRRTGFTADPAGCVACARCYLSCPVEHEQRRLMEPVAV